LIRLGNSRIKDHVWALLTQRQDSATLKAAAAISEPALEIARLRKLLSFADGDKKQMKADIKELEDDLKHRAIELDKRFDEVKQLRADQERLEKAGADEKQFTEDVLARNRKLRAELTELKANGIYTGAREDYE